MLIERRPGSRYEIAAIRFVVGMLELAPTAFGKVPARRLLVMGSGCERAIVEKRVAWHAEWHVAAALGHAIAARRDADDQLIHWTEASACGIASTKSSAIMPGLAISAARP